VEANERTEIWPARHEAGENIFIGVNSKVQGSWFRLMVARSWLPVTDLWQPEMTALLFGFYLFSVIRPLNVEPLNQVTDT